MSKVIIITRKGEYNSNSDFNDAISKSSPSLENLHVLEWLKSLAEYKWESALKDTATHKSDGTTTNNQQAAIQLLGFNPEQYLKALLENKVKQFIIDSFLAKEKEKMSNPYVHINDAVSLVLPENLQIGRDQAIPEFNLFMESVAKDCSVIGSDNILYIHDSQLYGTVIEDTTLFSKDDEKTIDLTTIKEDSTEKENPQFPGLMKLRNTYKFIAVFRHIPDPTSYFQSQILTMKFGQPTLVDKLEEIDADSESDWEEKAKKVLEVIGDFSDPSKETKGAQKT